MALYIHLGGAPPFSAHGACYLCWTAPQGKWVRTYKDIDMEGELVFCEKCATEFATILGFAPPEVVEEQKRVLVALEHKVSELEAKASAFDLFAASYEGAKDAEAKPRKANGADHRKPRATASSSA